MSKTAAWLALSLACIVPARAASPTPYKEYELLQGTGGSGSAFVTKCDDVYFAVTSIHQFDGKKPGIEDTSGKPLPLMPGPTRRAEDIQAWELADQGGTQPFLAYTKHFSLRNGEQLAVRSLAGDVVIGKAIGLGAAGYESDDRGKTIMVALQSPLDAAGMSGAPICKVSDGSVVGVLISADSPTGARSICFEALCLENPIDQWNRESKKKRKAPVDDRIPIVKTLQGKVYTKVRVTDSNSREIHIQHEGGVATIAPAALDSATRRLLKKTPSLEDAILHALDENPSLVLGSKEAALGMLVATIHWLVYPRLSMEAGAGVIEKFQLADEGSSGPTPFKKLGAAFAQIQDQLRVLGKAELDLARVTASSPSTNTTAEKKSLIGGYQALEEIIEKQRKLVEQLPKQPVGENLLFYIDDLEGTHLALQKYLIKPRVETLKKEL